MATDNALLGQRRVSGAIAETTTGTTMAITSAAATTIVINPLLVPDFTPNKKENQGDFGQLQSTRGLRSGTLTFRTEVTGGATPATWASTYLPACGLSLTTATFTPAKVAKTLTFGLWQDGKFWTMSGSRGKCKLTIEKGLPVYMDLDLFR
jgi:hypothetical protein